MATPLPANRASFTLDQLLSATGGSLVRGSATGVDHISINTRGLAPGAAFVALRGHVHDGHDHAKAAVSAGARVLIVEREVGATGAAVVRVPSTLRALGDLAQAHVQRWRKAGRRVVGITGSAGKTTTRVALAALLTHLFPGEVLATRGNLNNRIGVPMMLFSLNESHKTAVLELGTSEKGEIAELARIAMPDVALLTLIAEAHLEGLGSIVGVAEEKAALLVALSDTGIAIGNADDPRVMARMAPLGAQRATFGRHEHATVRILARTPLGLRHARIELEHADGRHVAFEAPLVGEAGALACAAAVATVEAAWGVHLESETLSEALSHVDVRLGAARLVPHTFEDGVAAIDDTYNANPASMAASIRAAAEMAEATERRLVLVLGEMRELGSEAERAHDDVGRAAGASGAGRVFAIGGGHAQRVVERAREAGLDARHLVSVDDAMVAVREAVRPGDLVLFKASRSVGLDRIVQALAHR